MSQQGDHDPSSSNASERGPVKTDETFVPVTIGQILSAKSDPETKKLVIDGAPRTCLNLIGSISVVNEDLNATTYTINDGTGLIDVVKNCESEDEKSFPKGTYIYVTGRVDASDENHKVMRAFRVTEVKDHNQIPFHMIQSLFALYQLTNRFAKDDMLSPMQTRGEQKDKAHKPSASSDVRQLVLDYLRDNNFSEGVEITKIIRDLGQQHVAETEIKETINQLSDNADIIPMSSNCYKLAQ